MNFNINEEKAEMDNDKRIENKKKALSVATSVPEQKSLVGMLGNQKAGNSAAATSNPTEEAVSIQPTNELLQYPADKQNDDQLKIFSTKADNVWYRSKKLIAGSFIENLSRSEN